MDSLNIARIAEEAKKDRKIIERVAALKNQGMGDAVIAVKVGLTKSEVYCIVESLKNK